MLKGVALITMTKRSMEQTTKTRQYMNQMRIAKLHLKSKKQKILLKKKLNRPNQKRQRLRKRSQKKRW